jgi:hypothetical protein
MTPIDRYVARIRFWLPGSRGRAAAEDLRDILTELVEAREQQAGRTLSETEVQAILKEFGRPEVIASRYSAAHPLVSAGLMPAYVRVLGISLLGVVLVQAAMALGSSPWEGFGEVLRTAIGRTVTGLLWGFTSITLTFAVLTRIYGPPPRDP